MNDDPADDPAVAVHRDDDASAYVITLDGAVVGRADYRVQTDAAGSERVVIPHTEINDAVGGRHLGSALARWALDDIRRRGQTVVPQCPFIAGWIARHADYADLVYAG